MTTKLRNAAGILLAAALLTQPIAAERTGLLDLLRPKDPAEGEVWEEDFTPKRGRFAPRRDKRRASAERDDPRPGPDSSEPDRDVWPCAASGTGYLGEDEPVVYLTFDAGYENGNVERILDGLRAEGVPGAFFILENLVNRNPELVKRMADEGHLVCNHTARHKDMTTFTEADFKEELGRMETAYRTLTGQEMARYYRPPEGRFTLENLDWAKELGYSTILWSFAYADWDNEKQPDPEAALEKILAGAHNGMVLLLHPTSETNARILPGLIRALKDRGFRFGTLDELTGGGGIGA